MLVDWGICAFGEPQPHLEIDLIPWGLLEPTLPLLGPGGRARCTSISIHWKAGQ